MSNGNTDRNSPYYYGTDSTYRPQTVRRNQARRTEPQYTLGLDGVPVLVQGSANRTGGNNQTSQTQPSASNTYTVSGVTYDRASGRALNPQTGKPSPNGYSINPSTGDRTDNSSPLSSPTRDVPKPDGSRGTSTSPGGGIPIMGMQDADDLYERLGLSSYSEYKPGYSRPKPQQQTSFTSISPSDPQFAEAFGQDLADQRIREANGGITSDRLRNALDDTESMRGESTMSAGDRGRYAFLDAEDSLVGLRARDRELGVVRAGGRYYGNTDEGFREVSDKAVRDYSANRVSGTDFKALFMNEESVATPAEAQSNSSRNPAAVTEMPTSNTAYGPVIDGEQYGQLLEAERGLSGVGPYRNGAAYGAYLDGREPMMRFQ